MALVRELGVRGLMLVALVHAAACSDDGVPATTDDPSGTTSASASETADSDPTTMTSTTAESSITDTGPESSGSSVTVTTTSDDTSGTVTSPSDTSSSDATGTGTDTDSTTGDPSEPCAAPSECQIVDNCCDCMALPEGVEPPACDMPCDQTACAALGIDPIAACELGSCELQPVPCNPLEVSCDQEPPECDDGMLPSVDPNSMCWTGDCIPAEYCDAVSSCADCASDEVCVENIAHFPTVTCSPIPEECDGTPSCACMGDEVCLSPFDTCTDDGPGITCSCIVC